MTMNDNNSSFAIQGNKIIGKSFSSNQIFLNLRTLGSLNSLIIKPSSKNDFIPASLKLD